MTPIHYLHSLKYLTGDQSRVTHYQDHVMGSFTWLSSHDNFSRASSVSRKHSINHGLEAWRVAENPHRPHGIRYCFTLHDESNQRLLGYDNAHAVSGRKRASASRKPEWDHRHEAEAVHFYPFVGAEQLPVDFWNDVERLVRVSERSTK
ncbi:MAG: hypothetical protein EXR85_00025 [Xanthomonadales bacterium]|nr:hypothetical protein [Xanthomonadales bacterium]